jgi:membrane protease subunit (stomatin/prohibitin family)
VSLSQFLSKQLIDVIQWNEPEVDVLAYRYPMEDMEIQDGGQLTVRETEMAAFVNQGKIADVFGPGMYTLTTANLPILTDLLSWKTGFESPFKSDVYFFSTRQQLDQKWGTQTPITMRDKEFGVVRLRGYGIFSYRIADPRVFFTQVSGTRANFYAADLQGQLRDSIIGVMTQIFANSEFSFLDMTSHEATIGAQIQEQAKPVFSALGLELTQFVVENLSLPDELQKSLDQRIGMNMVGDLDNYAKFAAAQAMTLAAANPGGGAALGMGLGVGSVMAQTMATTVHPVAGVKTKFCVECGHTIPKTAAFCPDCGGKQ